MVNKLQGPQRYQLFITKDFSVPGVEEYWQSLIDHDLLKYRIPEIFNPRLDDVLDMLEKPGQFCFGCVDLAEKRICGECMITGMQGLSAHIHFSVSPGYHGAKAQHMARSGAEQLFNTGLHSLIGCTPVDNRLAVRFIKKIGYVFKCYLTDVFVLAYADNKVCDGYISQLTADDLYKEKNNERQG